MAKFCKYCGSPLEEGQACSCPQAQAEAAQSQVQPEVQPQPQPEAQPQPEMQGQPGAAQTQTAPPQQPAAPSPVGVAFKNLIPFCKAYFRSPGQATRTAIGRKDLILSIILLVIQAIVVGLMIFAALARVCGLVQNIARQVLGLGSLLGGSSLFGGGLSVSASFLLCLIFGILAAVIAIAIFAVLLFALAKIMKSNCTFQDVIVACGANSLFVTALLLLAFLVFFFSFRVGLILFILAMLAWAIMGVITVQTVIPGAEQGKLWMLYIAAVLIALLVGGWVSSKFFGLSVNATRISYAGESFTIGQAMEGIGEIDFEDLMEDMIYDLF